MTKKQTKKSEDGDENVERVAVTGTSGARPAGQIARMIEEAMVAAITETQQRISEDEDRLATDEEVRDAMTAARKRVAQEIREADATASRLATEGKA